MTNKYYEKNRLHQKVRIIMKARINISNEDLVKASFERIGGVE